MAFVDFKPSVYDIHQISSRFWQIPSHIWHTLHSDSFVRFQFIFSVCNFSLPNWALAPSPLSPWLLATAVCARVYFFKLLLINSHIPFGVTFVPSIFFFEGNFLLTLNFPRRINKNEASCMYWSRIVWITSCDKWHDQSMDFLFIDLTRLAIAKTATLCCITW